MKSSTFAKPLPPQGRSFLFSVFLFLFLLFEATSSFASLSPTVDTLLRKGLYAEAATTLSSTPPNPQELGLRDFQLAQIRLLEKDWKGAKLLLEEASLKDPTLSFAPSPEFFKRMQDATTINVLLGRESNLTFELNIPSKNSPPSDPPREAVSEELLRKSTHFLWVFSILASLSVLFSVTSLFLLIKHKKLTQRPRSALRERWISLPNLSTVKREIECIFALLPKLNRSRETQAYFFRELTQARNSLNLISSMDLETETKTALMRSLLEELEFLKGLLQMETPLEVQGLTRCCK